MSSNNGLPLAPFTVPCQRLNTHTHGNKLYGVRHSTGTMISSTISSSAKNRLNQARSSSDNVLRLQKPSRSTMEQNDDDSSWTEDHSSQPRHGRMDSCGNILLLIGSDGAARIYDTEKSVGKTTHTKRAVVRCFVESRIIANFILRKESCHIQSY